ncbi:delta-lactam-biosynthetic de-N-acetylase [Cohnella panacarvi]|uniref:delta-lactam-biosynthetic de-N-acetylase n=1 Tax=Cohnella panacarvi TaxID=400776 RepID=UPI00047A57CC|nr:delta-lactam-biosynthetic de-N-acetylase [Cohnella panacarvi]
MRNKSATALAVLFILALAFQAIPASAAAVQAEPFHFGFKKSRGGQLPSIAEEGFMPILKNHQAIFLGNTDKKELYLTFDNGYENGNTGQILDVLKEKQVPAIFFVTGHFVKEQPELVKRMANEGHLIGNHSWSHPDMTRISDEQIRQELEKVRIEVAKLTQQQTMNYVRPPRGIFNNRVLGESQKHGYTNVFWSIAYRDWETNRQQGWNYAYTNVIGQLHPGAVILLHTVSRDNTLALDNIIDEARARGYEFKRLDTLEVKVYR